MTSLNNNLQNNKMETHIDWKSFSIKEKSGGWIKTGDGNKMEWVPGNGNWVKTGDGNKMEWVSGNGNWVKTGDGNKMEWVPEKNT